jgi:hypothetical protein
MAGAISRRQCLPEDAERLAEAVAGYIGKTFSFPAI